MTTTDELDKALTFGIGTLLYAATQTSLSAGPDAEGLFSKHAAVLETNRALLVAAPEMRAALIVAARHFGAPLGRAQAESDWKKVRDVLNLLGVDWQKEIYV